ncbi:methyltransferase-like 26 B [Oncorhynchus mykiss]|uniref:methyltransferase-like 26 B n=1 Tax=Oncorhynchus mykiss TaxID=8022 RepID=UPI001878A06B|nr:methyltransferase-like 26 B [Oncorhynchus mykiss]
MLISPLADRNQKELCSVLCDVLEEQSHRELFALELGSGIGQHVVNFAMATPFITCVRSYIAVTKVKTVLQPVHLDASEPWEKWAGLPRGACDVIVAINLLQCSSFDTVEGVVKGSGQILRQNGLLITHGPYAINGTITPSCMEDLDQELRQMNPGWGLPDIDILRQLAFGNGMRMERMIEREQDNKYLVYQDV